MTQAERRLYLIGILLHERSEYAGVAIPQNAAGQKELLRFLLNIRPPMPASQKFLQIQDEYLQEETARKGVTDLAGLLPIQDGLYLWQGDITALSCDAIVNAANSQMLGCFHPCHGCIDNAIHTFAGVQLRAACARMMALQGHEEETGTAKITPAFNLPCKYVLHTVGPIIQGPLTPRDEELLASCYQSCLELAERNGVQSIAFCCISAGEFHFPNQRAAEIAVKTVKEYKKRTHSGMEVIFNVFKDEDHRIYKKLLGTDKTAI